MRILWSNSRQRPAPVEDRCRAHDPARQSPWFRSAGRVLMDSFSWWTDLSALNLPQYARFVTVVAVKKLAWKTWRR
jgi:hypothetical protein